MTLLERARALLKRLSPPDVDTLDEEALATLVDDEQAPPELRRDAAERLVALAPVVLPTHHVVEARAPVCREISAWIARELAGDDAPIWHVVRSIVDPPPSDVPPPRPRPVPRDVAREPAAVTPQSKPEAVDHRLTAEEHREAWVRHIEANGLGPRRH